MAVNDKILKLLTPITEEEKSILEGHKFDRTIYADSSALVIDSKKFLKGNKLIEIRPHTRFLHFPEHTHNYVEVIYMCSGSTTHIVNGNKIILKEGELLFLNQSARQEILPAGEKDIAVNFLILPEFFEMDISSAGKYGGIISDFLIGCLSDKNKNIDYIHFNVGDMISVKNLVENLILTIIDDKPNKRSIRQATFSLLLLELSNCTENIIRKDDYDQELLFSTLKYIEVNYANGMLKEIAEKLGCGESRLSRLLKRLTGKNFKELIQIKRLSQAAYLLAETDMPVLEIAGNIGYDNTSYFFSIFKKQYGMSPKKYRDKYKKVYVK